MQVKDIKRSDVSIIVAIITALSHGNDVRSDKDTELRYESNKNQFSLQRSNLMIR